MRGRTCRGRSRAIIVVGSVGLGGMRVVGDGGMGIMVEEIVVVVGTVVEIMGEEVTGGETTEEGTEAVVTGGVMVEAMGSGITAVETVEAGVEEEVTREGMMEAGGEEVVMGVVAEEEMVVGEEAALAEAAVVEEGPRELKALVMSYVKENESQKKKRQKLTETLAVPEVAKRAVAAAAALTSTVYDRKTATSTHIVTRSPKTVTETGQFISCYYELRWTNLA